MTTTVSADDPHGGWVELVTPEGVQYYFNKVTQQTTWDKPEIMKTEDELDKAGEWVWMPHPEQAFVPARKVNVYFDGRIECETEDGQKHLIDKKIILEELSWSSLRRPVRDLVMLDVMNQPLILNNLKVRFAKNEIYTYVGTILISLNPYKLLPLYTPTVIDSYRNRGNKDMPPHVYVIADDAFNGMVEHNLSQSIIISGESGAGKTECTKQCLQYFAEVAGSSNNVEQKILQANPILEGFGNAKTVRNNNSSRFGKYVEIFFDPKASICGARNTNYLLEKIRVVQQSGDERNFHVFYQLCAGLDSRRRGQLHISDGLSYRYLNQSGNIKIDGVDDAHEFSEMETAMSALEFNDPEKADIFQIVSAILNLGNVTLKSIGEKKCVEENTVNLQHAADLFNVPIEALRKALLIRLMVARGEALEISLGVGEAEAARDALSKFVYARLFDWLVQRINTAIGLGESKKGRQIGILDIFGFEIFKVNSFEQLCINFANEKLQQHFNSHTFKLEERVYNEEKIQFQHVEYIDNQPVLDLIEMKPQGILPMIDEELRMPKSTDKSFLEKLHLAHDKKKEYGKVLSQPDNFIVKHYAGAVQYDSNGWLVKNQDRLLPDLCDLLSTSKNKLLASLFPRDDAQASGKTSLGLKFRQQLDDLMTTLNSTEPHYIRCVKPNPYKAPLEFVGPLVLEQLRYSGVFEAVEIRKKGFPFRLSHEDFAKRYKPVWPKKTWASYKLACADLIKAMKQKAEEVQMGVSKVLYRAAQHKDMELQRNVAVEKTVIFLQRVTRGYQVRKIAKKLKKLKPVLIAAMNKRDMASVDKALEVCTGIPFELYEWTKCKQLKVVLVEEKRLTAVFEHLVAQDPESVFQELSQSVASADEINFHSPIAERARQLLSEVHDRKQTRAWLVQGVEEADEEKLDWAVKRAKELNMTSMLPTQLKAANDMKERIAKEKKLIDQLEKACDRGGYINDGDKIDTSGLSSATSEAASFKMKTKNGLLIERKAQLLLDLRGKLSRALGTKEKPLWKAVEEVVIGAQEEFGSHPEVDKAKDEVSHQAAVEEVCERLNMAIADLDQDQLAYGIKQADALRVDAVKWPVVTVAPQYLDRIIEAKRLINEALDMVEQNHLDYAVQYAESFNYEKPETAECRRVRDLVIQLNTEAEHAAVQLEEEPMKDIVARADALRLTTETIEKLRTLLYSTPEEKFLQLQLKAAIALNDPARTIRMMIKLKDGFFKKSAAMFSFDNYPKLRSPEAWANLKLITFHRQELAAGMRRHTTEPIHATLTEILNSKNESLARKMFKNVLGWCGDRPMQGPVILAQEMLQYCLTETWLRDEVYCQLIKQINANPNPDSANKAWQLMCLALETFPPPPEFENYLEMFIRSRAPAPSERYLKLLHSAIYGGDRPAVPTEAEIQQVCQGRSLRQAAFDQVRDYIVPSAQLPQRAPLSFAPNFGGNMQMRQTGAGPTQTQIMQMQQSSASSPFTGTMNQSPNMYTQSGGITATQAANMNMNMNTNNGGGGMMGKQSAWEIAYTETGQEYYWNTETNEVTWDRPADL